MPTTATALYLARPTIRIDEQAHALVSELLDGMRMTEVEGGLSALEVRFVNWVATTNGGAGFAFEDGEILRHGAAITVYAGDESQPMEIFRGRISAIEFALPEGGPPELTVLAEDGLQSLRLPRRTKLYERKSPADVAREIARNAGLQVVVDALDAPTGDWVQFDESDLAFLRRLAARFAADLQIVGDELHIAPRADVRRREVSLSVPGDLRSCRILADLAEQPTEVTASGWDALQGERIDASAGGPPPGPGSGRSGAQIIEEAFAVRPVHLGHLTAATQQELRAIAEAAFAQRARRFVLCEATCEGNPEVRVGAHVALSGLGARFSNTYYVTRVCHRYDSILGYQTDFEAECPFVGEA